MKLSTRSRYGTRFMIYLASHQDQEPILLKEVAEREDISEKYLSQIVIALKSAGLIGANRGAHGGYFMAKKPSEITLLHIVEAFEERINLVNCSPGSTPCDRQSICVTQEIWQGLSLAVADYLEGFTLEDMVKRVKQQATPIMYDI